MLNTVLLNLNYNNKKGMTLILILTSLAIVTILFFSFITKSISTRNVQKVMSYSSNIEFLLNSAINLAILKIVEMRDEFVSAVKANRYGIEKPLKLFVSDLNSSQFPLPYGNFRVKSIDLIESKKKIIIVRIKAVATINKIEKQIQKTLQITIP